MSRKTGASQETGADRRSSVGGGGRNRVFPVGFYGTLLVGVFALFFGSLLATPESWLRTFVSLPLRAYSPR